jgi:hypothetical protein
MNVLSSGRRGGIALLVLVLVLIAVGIAYATIPDGSGVIHGCYARLDTTNPGRLRVIDSDLGQTCRLGEVALNWSQTGAPGPPGPSDGWDADNGDTVPTGGAFVHIPTAATGIPTGSYLISGHVVWSKLNSGTADLLCFLDVTNGLGGSLGGRGVASTAGGGSAPLGGHMIVTSGTASVGGECKEESGTAPVFVNVDVHVIKVGTLHP